MIFSTWSFGLFFVVVCGAYAALPTRRGQHALLLAASYFFYMCWNPWMISLIIGITLFDFGVGKFLHGSANDRSRRLALAASLAANLCLLAVFKYADFFVTSLRDLIESLGFHANLHPLSIILPVGISFHTFQTMSYTVDVYRRRVEPSGTLLEFALFVAFFPQLVAGPIVRAVDFLPQLKTRKRLEWSRLERGAALFLLGLTKKVLIADQLATIADPVFADPSRYATADLWLAMFAYGGQIYGDFAGYTDMAIAAACVLGFDLRPNFASPYLATGLSDFWRRWHISLSGWLRDYLYVPLGGSRGGIWLTCRNLMLTMLLGGLWHGASWTFVVWGGLHGLALVAEKLCRRPSPAGAAGRYETAGRSAAFRSEWESAAQKVGAWLLTLLVVHVAWVFFRCQPITPAGLLEPEPASWALARAAGFVYHLFIPSNPANAAWLAGKWSAVILLSLLGAMQMYEEWVRRGRPRLRLPAPAAGFAYATWVLVLLVFGADNVNPFIYFQF